MHKNISRKEKSQNGSIEKHEQLVDEIILYISRFNLGRAWPNKTGAAFRDGRLINYGLPGSADIIGLLTDGTFLAIEVKTGRATQSKKQKNFQKMIQTFNGIYIVARSIHDVQTTIGAEKPCKN